MPDVPTTQAAPEITEEPKDLRRSSLSEKQCNLPISDKDSDVEDGSRHCRHVVNLQIQKWSDFVVLKFIMTHFGGHIGPVSRPYRTTLKIPGNFPADSMIYNDYFYYWEIGQNWLSI